MRMRTHDRRRVRHGGGDAAGGEQRNVGQVVANVRAFFGRHVQCAAQAFPRAMELPGGPPSEGAMLVTCAYLVDPSSPWVLQSLFLAAIGEARDRGAAALEAFSYRYAEGESSYERFRVHKTVFPQDFLADFGFRVVRSAGRIGLSRLELGGLQPVTEGRRERVLEVVRSAFGVPEPVPAPRP